MDSVSNGGRRERTGRLQTYHASCDLPRRPSSFSVIADGSREDCAPSKSSLEGPSIRRGQQKSVMVMHRKIDAAMGLGRWFFRVCGVWR